MGALLVGTALAWASRWKHRSAWRSWGMALGANLGLVSVLAAVLLAGSGPLNAVRLPWSWAVLGGVGLALGFVVVRWPRAVGLPLAVVLGLAVWVASSQLSTLSPWSTPLARVRVMAQSAAVRTVELRIVRSGARVDEVVVDLAPQDWPLARLEVLSLPTWVPVTPSTWWRPAEASWLWALLPPDWKTTVTPRAPAAPPTWTPYQLVTLGTSAQWQALPLPKP